MKFRKRARPAVAEVQYGIDFGSCVSVQPSRAAAEEEIRDLAQWADIHATLVVRDLSPWRTAKPSGPDATSRLPISASPKPSGPEATTTESSKS